MVQALWHGSLSTACSCALLGGLLYHANAASHVGCRPTLLWIMLPEPVLLHVHLLLGTCVFMGVSLQPQALYCIQ